MLLRLITKEQYNALPEAIREHYKQSGDDYILDSNDDSFKTKIDEFRTNNIELRRQIESAQEDLEKFKGVDPVKYQEAVDKLQQLEDKKLLDAGQIDELVNQRTERMRSDYDGQVTALNTSLEEAQTGKSAAEQQLSNVLLNSEVATVVTEVGTVVKGGMPDVIARASTVWKLKDGELIPMNGKDVMYGKDGKAPITMKEWAEGLMETAPFLFEGSKGGGAGGNNGSGGSSVIDRSDSGAFSSNLEKIAAGEVKAQ